MFDEFEERRAADAPVERMPTNKAAYGSKRRGRIAAVVILPLLFVYANNASWVSSRTPSGPPTVLAHRGLSQRYDGFGFSGDRCEARRMRPPEHDYIENTIRSMQAAFDRGADVVEFDVQLTRDGRFAVFHDRMLDCRTDGDGATREHTMAELKALDVAYGYSADGGRTFPFRGRGVGSMPSIDDIFERFPERSFLIDIKGRGPEDGAMLAARLAELPDARRARLMVFGREDTLDGLRAELPGIATFSVTSIQRCLTRYIGYGWTGVVPGECRDAPLFVPINVAPFLWGWPDRFLDRMEGAGASVVVIGRLGAGGISPGLDNPDDLDRLPDGFDGGVWTNDVDLAREAVGRPPRF